MFRKLNRFTRESVVRVISRGGDLVISNTLMWSFGPTWFLYATIAGAVWNGVTDFFGQRFFTYQKRFFNQKKLLRETVPYIILRLTIAACGFGTLYVLFWFLMLPYIVASILTAVGFWYLSYNATKVFFTGSSHGIPRLLRYPWIMLRLITRKRLRYS